MVDFTIGLWTTVQLRNHWETASGHNLASDVIQNYLWENIEWDTSYTVDVTFGNNHPNPPKEALAPDRWKGWFRPPCDSGQTYYQNGREWLEEWHRCTNATDYDINLFVTDYDGTYGNTAGSASSQFYCVAEGHRVGKLDGEPMDARGPEPKYSQMYATILHEVGHAITMNGSGGCVTSGWDDEFTAFTYTNTSQQRNYTSPMVTWRDTNECCANYMNYDSAYDKAFYREYSDCVVNHIRPMDSNNK